MEKKKHSKKREFKHIGVYSFVSLLVVFLGLPIISMLMPIVAATFSIIGLIKFSQLDLVDRIFLIITWIIFILFLYV